MFGSRIVACYVLLLGSLMPFSAFAQAGKTLSAKPSLVATRNLGNARVRTVNLAQGGRMQFMHNGQLLTGDLSKAKVYMMRNGQKVEVPRSQWQAMLKPGVQVTVVVPPGQQPSKLVVIAIIAVLIGLLLPAVQK